MEVDERIFRDRQNPLDFMEDTEFLEKYRLNREVTFLLCNRLKGRPKRPKKRPQSLSVSLQMCCITVLCNWEFSVSDWRCAGNKQILRFKSHP